jgi:hypothetical protein
VKGRFSFGDRVRVAGRSVPRAIDAAYFGPGGVAARRERWALANVARLDPPVAGNCAQVGPQTKVQDLTW